MARSAAIVDRVAIKNCTANATRMARPHDQRGDDQLPGAHGAREATGPEARGSRRWRCRRGETAGRCQTGGSHRPDGEDLHTMRDALGGVQSVLVLGGGSEIALATVAGWWRDRCRTVVLAGAAPEAARRTVAELRQPAPPTVDTVAFDAARPRVPREGDRRASSTATATSTSCCWRSACSATRRTSTPHPARRGRGRRPPTTSARSRQASPSPTGSRSRATACWWSSRRWPASGRARTTSSTARRRPALDAFAQGLGDSLVGHRRPRHGRPARVRAHPDDRGHGRRHRSPRPPTRSPTTSSTACAAAGEIVWAPAMLR